MEYSEKVIEHFMCPQNCGTLEKADASFAYGDPGCGDAVIFFIKVNNGIIEDISYLVYGCCAAIASASMTSVLAKGLSLDNAEKITDDQIDMALGGLPENKKHCSNLGAFALAGVIKKYKNTINEKQQN
jgi:nitrogen fixation protein NifU and related proteins